MTRTKTWHGFDYRLSKPVEKPRPEWRAEINAAARTVRARGDLLLLDRAGRIYLEVYDHDK